MNSVITKKNRSRLRLFSLLVMTTFLGAYSIASSQSLFVEIFGGRVKGGETLRVRQGDQVQVRFLSDRPIILHLHGYDLDVNVVPSAPAFLTFKAEMAGRFPMHEHRTGAGNHRAVLFIEVYP
jgi:hypothetical protein